MSGVVSEFNGRNGPVALQQSDVVNVLPNATVPGAVTINGVLSAASADLSGNVTVGGALSTLVNLNGTLPAQQGQGFTAGWNYNAGVGEVDFFNYPDGGPGGFRLYSVNSSNVATLLATLDGSGNLTIPGALIAASADVSGAMTVGGALSAASADLSGNVTVGGALSGTTADLSGNVTVGSALSAATADISGNVTVGGALSAGSVGITNAISAANAFVIGGDVPPSIQGSMFTWNLLPPTVSGGAEEPLVGGLGSAVILNQYGGGAGGFSFYDGPDGGPWTKTFGVDGVNTGTPGTGHFSGGLKTAHNTLDDGSGNVTVGGALSAASADVTGNATIAGSLSLGDISSALSASVTGGATPASTQGALFTWNLLPASVSGGADSVGSGGGDAVILNQYGGGVGGFKFYDGPDGGPWTQTFAVDGINTGTAGTGRFSGGLHTANNTLDDGSGNAAFSGTVTAQSLSASLSNSTALTAGGTTAQTIANLFAERGVTPFDFGAAGNGTTDDTAAIQAALNTGKPVILPNGYTFALASSLNLPIGGVLVGQGGKLAPSTVNAAINVSPSTTTDYRGALITGVRIEPTVAGGYGIWAAFANNFTIENCEFTGCSAASVELTSCQYWSIRNCLVRSSGAPAYQPGGSIISTASWTSSGGGTLGGPGTIENVQFGPGPQASGVTSPCIHIVNSPAVDVINCVGPDLAWGGSTSSPPPITFILIEGQCQGNVIRGCYATLMSYGVLIQPQGGTRTPVAGTVMPSYILVDGCNFDSFGSAGVGVFGSVAFPNGSFIWVRGGGITEPQSIVTGATVSAGGSGYEVGDILTLPAPSAQVEGAPAMLEVTAVSSGAVTGVSVFNGGLTQTAFSGAQSVTGGHGTGATFTLTQSNAATSIYMQYVSDTRVDSVQLQNYGGGIYGDGVVFENCTRPAIANNTFEAFSVAVAYNNCTNFMDFGNVFNGNSTNFYTYGLSGQEGAVGTAGDLYASGVAAQAVFTNSLATNPAGGTLEVNNAIDFNSNVTGQFAIDNPTTLASATWYQNTLGGPAWLSVPVLLPVGASANLYVAQESGGTGTSSPVAWVGNASGSGQSIVLSLNGVIPTGASYYISVVNGASLNPSGYPNGFYRFL